jgi:hypothetical protein
LDGVEKHKRLLHFNIRSVDQLVRSFKQSIRSESEFNSHCMQGLLLIYFFVCPADSRALRFNDQRRQHSLHPVTVQSVSWGRSSVSVASPPVVRNVPGSFLFSEKWQRYLYFLKSYSLKP